MRLTYALALLMLLIPILYALYSASAAIRGALAFALIRFAFWFSPELDVAFSAALSRIVRERAEKREGYDVRISR